ncbi:MAG: hypothetical protein IRZ28_03510 [Steroidobacteraceae bacterium]|nr:hypothetical protein [Steroidobacteraceae bacterium]
MQSGRNSGLPRAVATDGHRLALCETELAERAKSRAQWRGLQR